MCVCNDEHGKEDIISDSRRLHLYCQWHIVPFYKIFPWLTKLTPLSRQAEEARARAEELDRQEAELQLKLLAQVTQRRLEEERKREAQVRWSFVMMVSSLCLHQLKRNNVVPALEYRDLLIAVMKIAY
jgi:hypothetical protein